MENKNEELYETIPHLLYIYVRTLFCVNRYIVPLSYLWMRLDQFLGNLMLLRLDFFKKC